MMQKPYTLVELSKNPIAPNGRILASDVYALVGSKKKKRSELTVALDSESCNIYDVRTSKLITSYAVSPQATFTCPPCSVRSRPQGVESARRFTYYSVIDPKTKLHCFSESFNKGSAQERQFHRSTFDVKDSASRIIHLETLVGPQKNTLQSEVKLLAVHEDGEIRCLSQDLQMEEWKRRAILGSSLCVEHASVMSLSQANQSLLRNREDILAVLGHDADASDTCLLFLIIRAPNLPASSGGNQLYLRVFHIRASESVRQPLQELISLTLPEPKCTKSEKSNYSWHGSSGTLLQNTSSDLAVYDLVGLVPRLVHYTQSDSTKIKSCLRLSASLIALNTPMAMSIVDLQYCSLQAEQTLESLSEDHNETAKRKHTAKDDKGTCLLSYFAPLDLIVVLQGRKLLAVQLSGGLQQATNSRKRKRDGLLVNSLGRGVPSFSEKRPEYRIRHAISSPLGTELPNPRAHDSWIATRDRLESLFKEKDFDEFESIMLSELGIADEKEEKNFTPGDLHRSVEARARNLPDLRKVYFLLNKVFILEQSQQPTEQSALDQILKVSWFPERLCRPLIRHGLFSIDHIEASLKHSHSLSTTKHIKVGAYIQALIDWDKSLRTLQLILNNPVPLDAREIVHALRYFMQLLYKPESPGSIKQLTDGRQQEEEGFGQSTDREDDKNPVDSISPYSKTEVKVAHNMLESILVRLHFLSVSKVTKALKTEFSTQELRALVDLLRIELARGHWLSAHGEETPAPLGDGHSDNDQVCIIANLLNSVIDSIGTGGWVLGASITDDLTDTEDTIAYMKAEISATLEGIEEATYLKGLLGQILLYGKTTTSSQKKSHNFLGATQQLHQIQSMPVNGVGMGSSFLPLNRKAAQGVPTKKVSVGGELIERSQRDIERLKNKMVGKYSFDRIVI
ncbi:hypothetical protein MMC07_001180 [Pseudocyphellaria aurata]|nr:hypothetical protein [Pseudocyphellaria aurata]